MSSTTTTVTKATRNRNRRLRKAKLKKKRVEVTTTTSTKTNKGKPKGSNYHFGIRLSKCTQTYAMALIDPFAPLTTLPCIPDSNILPSHKIMTKARGVFSTGAAGVGWVAMNPLFGIINNAAPLGANGFTTVVYTDNSYVGNAYGYTVAGGAITTPGVNSANTNSILTSQFFLTPAVQYRLVAAGLSCRYIGTDFKNQGRIVLYRAQSNSAIPVGSTAPYFLQDNYTVSVPVRRSSEYVYYIPDTYALTSYNGLTPIENIYSGVYNNYIIYIDGGDTTTPQSWEFEFVGFYEVIGANLDLTKSESDAPGFSAIHTSLPTQAPSRPPSQEAASFLGNVYNALSESISGLAVEGARAAPRMALNMGASYLSNMMTGTQMNNRQRIRY